MRRRLATLLLLAAALLALPALAGCGEEEHLEVREGEPLELGELGFNVQITRFLNPDQPDDMNYLDGAPPLSEGEQYLGVFMQVANDGEESNVVPYPLKIIDTRGQIYEQLELENAFSLDPGTPVLPDEVLPEAGSAAADGPIKGSMVLFAIEETATENRPLELEVPGAGGTGVVELDI